MPSPVMKKALSQLQSNVHTLTNTYLETVRPVHKVSVQIVQAKGVQRQLEAMRYLVSAMMGVPQLKVR